MRHIIRQPDPEVSREQMMKRLPDRLRKWLIIDEASEVTPEQFRFLKDFSDQLKDAVKESKNARTEA